MLHVRVYGNEFEVNFVHTPPADLQRIKQLEEELAAARKEVRERETVCKVTRLTDGRPDPGYLANSGSTTCSFDDNFCKERGRKIALARAIHGFSRQARTQIWEAYHKSRLPVQLKSDQPESAAPA